MNSNLRLLILVSLFGVLFMLIIKIWDGKLAFIISGIACGYMGIHINNYIDRRNRK